MRILALFFLLFWSVLARSAVINIEYQFTPFVGDPAVAGHVDSVPGRAVIFLNNIPVAEQEISEKSLPVIFAAHEIAPAVWMPVKSFGALVRKGKNTLRIEFTPKDAKLAYRSRLQWAQVTDQVKQENAPGSYKATNQAGEGMETQDQQGKAVLENEFNADFVHSVPWHSYPPVKALKPEDRQILSKRVIKRATAFEPDFEDVYKLLKMQPGLQLADLRKMQCLEQAYSAGVRVPVPKPEDIEVNLTGGPVVIVKRKSGALYPIEPDPFAHIKGENIQVCAGVVLAMAFPRYLLFVRTPTGEWEPVHQ